jgi:DNA-binding MarR family transcriptional regulator
MNKNHALSNLITSFIRNVNKYNEFNQKPYNPGGGHLIHPSEMHTLNSIATYDGLNISELGKKLGITKSAASQVVIKLENKGMLEKHFSPESNKSIFVTLTKTGEAIVRHFRSSQDEIFSLFTDALKKTDEDKILFIQQVFDSIEQNLDTKLGK